MKIYELNIMFVVVVFSTDEKTNIYVLQYSSAKIEFMNEN